MQGIGGAAMETRFAITLLLEFVGIDKKPGERGNPLEPVPFKIFPKNNRMSMVLGLCCVYDGDDDPFDPGYSGVVPCKWTGPLPKKPYMAEVVDHDLGADDHPKQSSTGSFTGFYR